MMNIRTVTTSMILVLLLTAFPWDQGAGGEEPVFSENAPEPDIEDFSMVLENKTESYFLEIDVTGSVSGNAEQVNLSLVIQNETEKMEGLWLEPMDQSLLFFELRLEGIGPTDNPWASWEFYFMLNIPKGDDLWEIIEFIGGGEDLNLSGINQTLDPEEIDPDELARQLSELKVEVIARALSGNGTYGEDRMDVTMDVAGAISSFFLGDDDKPVDGDDGTVEKDDGGDSGWVLYVMISAGVLLLMVMILIIILVISLMLRKKKSGEIF